MNVWRGQIFQAENATLSYADGDTTGLPRSFNVRVNNGTAQNKAFPIVAAGDWTKVGQAQITLSRFTAGSTNTVQFLGDGIHAAPDLDWIEIIAAQ